MDRQTAEQAPQSMAPALVKQLLVSLQIPCDSNALQQACAQTAHSSTSPGPAQWLRQVLIQAGLKNLTPVQLPWRRLDQRRLPALVWTGDEWWLVERDAAGRLTLINAAGERRGADDTELQDALVVWLRAPTRRSAEADSVLSGNLADRKSVG